MVTEKRYANYHHKRQLGCQVYLTQVSTLFDEIMLSEQSITEILQEWSYWDGPPAQGLERPVQLPDVILEKAWNYEFFYA